MSRSDVGLTPLELDVLGRLSLLVLGATASDLALHRYQAGVVLRTYRDAAQRSAFEARTLRALRSLEGQGLVERVGDEWRATVFGRAVVKKARER